MPALTSLLYVLQFLSLEIIREKISKGERNDAMFNWEVYWRVKVIDNSIGSQIRFNCQYESEVSASGFLQVVSLVWSTAICWTLQPLWQHRCLLFQFCHQIFTLQWPTHIETTDHQRDFWLWLLALRFHPRWCSGAGRGSCKSSPPYLYVPYCLLSNMSSSEHLLVLFVLVSVTNHFGRIFAAVRRLCKHWEGSWCWAGQSPQKTVKTESLVPLGPGWGSQFESGTEGPGLQSCPL